MQTFTDIYRHRFVLSTLIAKNFKTMYRNMSLGFFWSLLNPLVLVAVLSFVFCVFFGSDLKQPSRIITVLIPYNFFVYSLSGCAGSIISNTSLVRKVAFPRQILPVSVIVTHLIHFAIQIPLIVLILLLFDTENPILTINLLWLPVILVVQLGLSVGAGLLVAGANVMYRDVQYIVDSLLTVLFWMSPVLYVPRDHLRDYVDTWLFTAYYLNPVSGILDAWRSVLFFGQSPDFKTFGMAVAITVVIGVIGVRSFWIHEREFADLI